MNNISISNTKLIKTIRNKISKKSSSITFDKHIESIQGSITKLRAFNKEIDNLSATINTLPKLKKHLNGIKKDALETVGNDKFNKMGLLSIHEDSRKPIKNALNILSKKFKILKAKHLNFVYRGKRKVMRISVNQPGMSRDDIKIYCTKVSKQLFKDGVTGIIDVSLRYSEAWRTGVQTKIGQEVNLFEVLNDYETGLVEQENFDAFVIYILQDNTTGEGGSDRYNDCLYNCLLKVLYTTLKWKSPEEFKKFLKIPRLSCVNINQMEKIENALNNISINVSGDYSYATKKKSTKIINLKLCDDHYTNDFEGSESKVKNISYKARKPLIYNSITYMCYDGKKEYKLSIEEKAAIYQWKTEYILIPRDRKRNLTLKEEYELFINDANILLKETNGLINLYKCGDELTASLNLFDLYTKHIANPPKIKQLEAKFISSCKGAIIFGESYEGEAYKYDVKSMYPSIQASQQTFPIDEGEILYMTNDEFINLPFYKYGIYKCNINKSDRHTNKLFRFNEQNYYTHIDLTRAKELNLEMNIIIDNEPNFLYYSREKLICGSELFKQFVNTMYDFKQRKLPRSKFILNILWGALCTKATKNKVISDKNDEYIFPSDNKLMYIKPSMHDDEDLIEYVKNDKMYKYGFGRVGPFIISKAKSVISHIMEPYKNDIVRAHTDGFLLTRKENIITGNELGQLAYEGYCNNAKVLNCNSVLGKFKM